MGIFVRYIQEIEFQELILGLLQALAFKTVINIYFKSSLKYLRSRV